MQVDGQVKPGEGEGMQMGPGGEMAVKLSGTQSGTTVLDRQSGWATRVDLKQDMSGEMTITPPPGQGQAMVIPMKITGTITIRPRRRSGRRAGDATGVRCRRRARAGPDGSRGVKLGVISDSHDRLPTLAAALRWLADERVDALLHAGDYVAPFAAKLLTPDALPDTLRRVPLHGIYGNNDGERDGLKKLLPQLVDGPLRVGFDTPHGRRTVVMAHFLGWVEPGDLDGADVVVSGHDHTALIERRDGRLFVNPGECCGWLTGRCTVAVVDLSQPEPVARLIDVPG